MGRARTWSLDWMASLLVVAEKLIEVKLQPAADG
jgi:hypothetical protein